MCTLLCAAMSYHCRQRAHRIFKEALRCSYDNAKIWENYLVVSHTPSHACTRGVTCGVKGECGAEGMGRDPEGISEVVRCPGEVSGCRSADSASGWSHTRVPREILSARYTQDMYMYVLWRSVTACEYRHALGQLLGRITSRGQVPAEVWRQYAQFHLASSSREDHVKVCPSPSPSPSPHWVYHTCIQGVQELPKAQRAARLQADWHKTLQGLSTVSQFTIAYCRGVIGLSVCMPAYMSVRLPACLFVRLPVCLYACMYVCLYACRYVCLLHLHVCISVHLHVCLLVCVPACMSVRLQVCLFVRLHIRLFVHLHSYYVCFVCLHVCLYACIIIIMSVCMPACMSVCMPAYVCVSVGSRELFAEGSAVQEKKQALATLSSAKLALQGVITKTKVRECDGCWPVISCDICGRVLVWAVKILFRSCWETWRQK